MHGLVRAAVYNHLVLQRVRELVEVLLGQVGVNDGLGLRLLGLSLGMGARHLLDVAGTEAVADANRLPTALGEYLRELVDVTVGVRPRTQGKPKKASSKARRNFEG